MIGSRIDPRGLLGSAEGRYRLVAALWILITAVTRFRVAFADPRALISHNVYPDDAFYYFQIARNIVTGHGMTFDGVTPTNGVQPLFLGLLLPIMSAGAENPLLPVRISAVILALFAAATAWCLLDLSRRIGGRTTALIVVGFWAVTPYFIVHGVNGLETGFAMGLAVLLLQLYVRWFREFADAPRSRYLIFGILSGLAVLARIDLAILLAAIALDATWRWRAAGKTNLRGARNALFAAFLTWLPWGVTSWVATGAVLPASGDANRLIARNYGWPNEPPVWFHYPPGRGPEDPTRHLFDPAHVPSLYPVELATKLAAIFAMEHPLAWPLRSDAAFAIWPDVNRYRPLVVFRAAPGVGLAALILLAAGTFYLYRRAMRRAPRLPSVSGLVVIYLLLMAAAYAWVVQSHWYFGRYLAVPVILSLVVLVAAGARLVHAVGIGRPWVRGIGAALLAVLFVGQGLQLRFFERLKAVDPTSGAYLTKWETLSPWIEPGAKVGAFQAGIFGYFSGRQVVNLDGKVNPAALEALREQQMHRYILEQGIDYVIDWDMVIYCLCRRYTRAGELTLEPVARDERGVPMALYRVVRPHS